MRTNTRILFSTCSALLLCTAGGGLALAQDQPQPQPGDQPMVPQPAPTPAMTPPPSGSPAGYDDRGSQGGTRGFLDEYGLSLSVGGGIMGFTDKTMRDTTSTGGLWDVRVGVLTNKWVGAELAYEGGLQNIDALGLDTDARLLSTALEADARVNFIQGRWGVQPYAFAGVGWRRFELNNVSTNTSDVNDQDDLVEIPLGVGLGMRYQGFLVDVRGSFRPAFDNDLVPTDNTGDHADMHTWATALRLGYAW
jgi:hypothetical protein